MSLLLDPVPLCAVAALHGGGILLACAARISQGSRLESWLQILSLAAMLALACAVIVWQSQKEAFWLITAMTLVGMVLILVTDLRRHEELVNR